MYNTNNPVLLEILVPSVFFFLLFVF